MVEQSFHQSFCFYQCYPDSVWGKLHEQQSKHGQWCDLVLQYSDSRFTSLNSSLHLLMGYGAGCRRVCWLRNINESRHFLLLNLWLTLWAVFVLRSHYRQNGKCSFCILQECWDVAKVFGEQLGWDFSLVGAFCNVNIEKKKRPDQKIYLTCLRVKLCTFSGALFPKSDPWVLLKGRCGFCQNNAVFLAPKNRGLCRQEDLRDKKVGTYRTLPIHCGSKGLAKTHCPPVSVKILSTQGKWSWCGWRNKQEWISVSTCLFMYFRGYFLC